MNKEKNITGGAVEEKLNRPLDELVKEANKKIKKGGLKKKNNSNNNANNRATQRRKNTKGPHSPKGGNNIKPSQVKITIQNDYARAKGRERQRDMRGGDRIMGRMDDRGLDYGRPVTQRPLYRPPAARLPKIRKP